MSHCASCSGYVNVTKYPNETTWVQSTTPCPGVECEACKEKDAEIEEIRATYARIVAEQCAPDETHCTCVPALRAEISRLKNELATVLENSATWRELYEKYARLHGEQCAETDHLRAEPLRQECDRLMQGVAGQKVALTELQVTQDRTYEANVHLSEEVDRLRALVDVGKEMAAVLEKAVQWSEVLGEQSPDASRPTETLLARWRELEVKVK